MRRHYYRTREYAHFVTKFNADQLRANYFGKSPLMVDNNDQSSQDSSSIHVCYFKAKKVKTNNNVKWSGFVTIKKMYYLVNPFL